MQDQDQPELVGERAALIQKKRDWLLNYDRHCGVCFDAFTLCERGAADAPDAANCKAALDACVRGGLINDAGAGEADADAPEQDAAIVADPDPAIVGEADAAQGQDADAASGDDASSADADAGAATCVARPDSLDAGRRRGIGAGRDSGVECPPQASADAAVNADAGAAEDADDVADAEVDDDELATESEDAGAPAGRGRPGRAANALDESVSLCLEATQICLDDSASTQDCVAALRDCVRVALERTFDDLCSVQVAACRAEGAPAAATRSVESLCSDDLSFH